MRIIGNTVKYVVFKGFKYGLILGGIYGTLLVPIIGTLYGLVIGAVMGLVLGLVDGLILGWIRLQFFDAISEKATHRITLIAMLITYVGAVLCLCVLYDSFDDWKNFAIQVPAAIAAVAAFYAAHGLVDLYEDSSTASDSKSNAQLPTEMIRGQS